jgi:hypothetical protein
MGNFNDKMLILFSITKNKNTPPSPKKETKTLKQEA